MVASYFAAAAALGEAAERSVGLSRSCASALHHRLPIGGPVALPSLEGGAGCCLASWRSRERRAAGIGEDLAGVGAEQPPEAPCEPGKAEREASSRLSESAGGVAEDSTRYTEVELGALRSPATGVRCCRTGHRMYAMAQKVPQQLSVG